MRVPTVHLNGTGKEMLIRGYEAAYHALVEAQKALGNIEFNPRDYYVQGPDAWTEAAKEMEARLTVIGKVKDESEQVLEAIE